MRKPKKTAIPEIWPPFQLLYFTEMRWNLFSGKKVRERW